MKNSSIPKPYPTACTVSQAKQFFWFVGGCSLKNESASRIPRRGSGSTIAALGAVAWLGLLPATAAMADPARQWPQWRGPLANGVAPHGTPPTSWSETQNVKWKVQLPGRGTGTPIIWADRIYIQAAIPTGKKVDPPKAENQPAAVIGNVQFFGQVQNPSQNQNRENRPPGGPGGQGGPGGRRGGGGFGRSEVPTEFHQFALLALDRKTGKIEWQKNAREVVPHEGHHQDHGFASHSPVTDGTSIYAWFGSRGLHAYDVAGNLKWQKDLGTMRTINGFGEGNSPALHGNTLVINWDHEGEDFIAAFDKQSGHELWRQPRDEKTTWGTPLIIEHEGKAQVVVSASQRVRCYDLATGKQIWECGGMTANVIPTPVSDFGMVFATSGFRGNALLAIKLGKTGDLTDTDAIAWRHGRGTPYVPSPLLYGERLFFLAGNNAMFSCFGAKSGAPLFVDQRLEGPVGFYASPVAAAGNVYLAGRNGTSLVIKAADQFEVVATNVLSEKIDASPAIAGSELFLRGHQHLYCIAEK